MIHTIKRKRNIIANVLGLVLGLAFVLLTSISFFAVIENDLTLSISNNSVAEVLDLIVSSLLVAAGTDFVHQGLIKLSPSEFEKECTCIEIKNLGKIVDINTRG